MTEQPRKDEAAMKRETIAFLSGPWQEFYDAHTALTELVRKNLFIPKTTDELQEFFNHKLNLSEGTCRVFDGHYQPYRTRSHHPGLDDEQAAEFLYGQLGLQAEFANGIQPYMQCLAVNRRNLPLQVLLEKVLEKWDSPSQLSEGAATNLNVGVRIRDGKAGVFKKGQLAAYADRHGLRNETCGTSFPRIANEVEGWYKHNRSRISADDCMALEVAVERYRAAYTGLLPFIDAAREYINQQTLFTDKAERSDPRVSSVSLP